MTPISRKAARAVGAALFFTGEPCKYGHVGERRTGNGTCVQCARAGVKNWRKKNPEKRAAQSKRYASKHPETSRKARIRYYKVHHKEMRVKEHERLKEWRRLHPEELRVYASEYKERQRAKQQMIAGGPPSECCDICGSKGVTVFDHCHALMYFRGWLCNRCNRTLGQVKDDVSLLQKMISYLERNQAEADKKEKFESKLIRL